MASQQRSVIKLGSAVVAPDGRVDPGRLASFAGQIAALLKGRSQVIVVSSGAVASGFRGLGLVRPPRSIVKRQAAAAVGQRRLMSAWADAFAPHGLEVAQVLLAADDLEDRRRFLNARRTILELLASKVVPIVNENDTVSYDELKVGDNDRLCALVAGLVDATFLLMLSSVEGLMEEGDRSRIVPLVDNIRAAMRHVRTTTSATGTGGMATKLDAAATAVGWGIPAAIVGGDVGDSILRALAGEPIGTRFPAPFPARGSTRRLAKRWLAAGARSHGTVVVDAGAQSAIRRRGGSLLPSGVAGVKGKFERGQLVDIAGPDGVFARGIASYAAAEVAAIAGKRATQIAATLGYHYADEVIHRDSLVLLESDPGETAPGEGSRTEGDR